MASIDIDYLGRIVVRLIERVPLFKGLTQAELLSFLNGSRLEEVGAGEMVFREGDSSSSIFVILRGSVEVTLDINEDVGATVCILEAGECFGEMALADKLSRSASVKTREKTLLCVLSVASVDGAPEVARIIYANLATTLAKRCIVREARLAKYLRARCQQECVQLIVASATPPMAPLDSCVLDELMQIGRGKSVNAGQQLVKTGTTGQSLYVLLEGEAEVSRGAGAQRQQLALLGRGACFGEIGFLHGDHGRIAEVTATADSQLLRIDVNDLGKARQLVLPLYQYLARKLSVRLRGLNQVYAQLANAECFSDCPYRTETACA